MAAHADDDLWDEEDDRGDRSDEDEPTIPCPYCKHEIHADSVRCPRCERSLSDEDRPPAGKTWWIVLGTLLGLYAVYRWIAG